MGELRRHLNSKKGKTIMGTCYMGYSRVKLMQVSELLQNRAQDKEEYKQALRKFGARTRLKKGKAGYCPEPDREFYDPTRSVTKTDLWKRPDLYAGLVLLQLEIVPGRCSSMRIASCIYDILLTVTQMKQGYAKHGGDLVQGFAVVGEVRQKGGKAGECKALVPVPDEIVRDALAKVRFDIGAKLFT